MLSKSLRGSLSTVPVTGDEMSEKVYMVVRIGEDYSENIRIFKHMTTAVKFIQDPVNKPCTVWGELEIEEFEIF